MPIEFGLEFMTVIGSQSMYPKRELLDRVIDEAYCFFACGSHRFSYSHAGGIVNGGILETLVFLAGDIEEFEEFHTYLDMMPRNLYLILMSLYGSPFGVSGKAV